MMFKQFEWRILVRVVLLFITISVASFLLVKELYVYLLLAAPVIIYQVVDFYNFHKKAHDELNQFVESIHYRDFSRNFDVKHAPVEIQPLRQGFNEINTTFKVISKEKETDYDDGLRLWEKRTEGDVIDTSDLTDAEREKLLRYRRELYRERRYKNESA